ncbi:MAG TPA: SPW repeat protein [Longimicrobiaceae bacterium]|nr:SPW repeat protein [Longimicrobiaceae bacterium]
MRFFSTRTHGLLDFVVAVILMGSPWLLGFANGGPQANVPVLVGIAIIVYSLCTDYESGALRRIQVPVHLWLDAGAGLVLITSPWLFGFDQQVWVPHVVMGVGTIVIAFFSNTIPSYERRG